MNRKDGIKVLKVHSVDYHRNGICGDGFKVAVYDANVDGTKRRMVTVRFYDDAGENLSEIRTATFDAAMLAAGNCKFCENSWRGDVFASATDDAGVFAEPANPTERKEIL